MIERSFDRARALMEELATRKMQLDVLSQTKEITFDNKNTGIWSKILSFRKEKSFCVSDYSRRDIAGIFDRRIMHGLIDEAKSLLNKRISDIIVELGEL